MTSVFSQRLLLLRSCASFDNLTSSCKRRLLHRPSWEQDKVYLVQYPVSPHIRTISPFTLKLETWLRLNKVPYENVHTVRPHPKVRQIPYIELNGQELPDSNMIIKTLTDKFGGLEGDKGLHGRQRALGHTLAVTLEHHTAQIGFYWRYGHNNTEFADKLMENFAEKKVSMWFFKNIQPFGLRVKGYLNGYARHSFEEVAKMSFLDLDAVSQILGDNNYVLGTATPTTLDCTVFGHLAQFLYIPMDFPQKAYMHDHCGNVVRFVDRIRDEAWPDWNQMCSAKSMVGRLGKDFEKSKLNNP